MTEENRSLEDLIAANTTKSESVDDELKITQGLGKMLKDSLCAECQLSKQECEAAGQHRYRAMTTVQVYLSRKDVAKKRSSSS